MSIQCIIQQMEFINTIWSLIKGLIISLFYISSNNNKNVGSTDEDGQKGGLPEELQEELMPRHVAVILDGNRRWANKRGLSYVEGYSAGVTAMNDFVGMCVNFNIPVISLFVFSSENWRRPKVEVDYLVELFEESLRTSLGSTLSRGGRVTIIGDMSLFPISLQKVIKDLEESTKNNTKYHLLLAMSYSGQNDIVQACQSIATKVEEGLLKPEDVTNSLIEQELETKVSKIPNPDLLIRTSGESRISNYYLWQSAYTELYFTNTYWPDFGEVDFVKALRSFQQRGRRFGG